MTVTGWLGQLPGWFGQVGASGRSGQGLSHNLTILTQLVLDHYELSGNKIVIPSLNDLVADLTNPLI